MTTTTQTTTLQTASLSLRSATVTARGRTTTEAFERLCAKVDEFGLYAETAGVAVVWGTVTTIIVTTTDK